MRRKTSSLTSYTGSDSNCKVNWIASRVSITTSATALDTAANGGAAQYVHSRNLGKPPNPHTNKGRIHLIHMAMLAVRITNAGAVNAAATLVAQLRRRDPGAGSVPSYFFGDADYDELIALEIPYTGSSDMESTGVLGTMVPEANTNHRVVRLDKPITMVEPYFLKVRGAVTSQGVNNVNIIAVMYLLTETVYVKGSEYRKLLDAYTQTSGLIERRE